MNNNTSEELEKKVEEARQALMLAMIETKRAEQKLKARQREVELAQKYLEDERKTK